jgi:tRNA nucleotidyltransferase (CCA-adding enzyme)
LWQALLAGFLSVDAGAIAAALSDKRQIPERLHAARVAAVSAVLARERPAQLE